MGQHGMFEEWVRDSLKRSFLPVRAQLVVGSDKRPGRAEVVVHVGEGSQKRSITRHVHTYGKRWFGRNIDEAAVARLDATESTETRVLANLDRLTAELYEVELRLDLNTAAKKEEGADKVALQKERRKLNAKRREFEPLVADATEVALDAKANADKARREIPRMTEFVF